MSKKNKTPDPFASREAEKYAKPIASRELILEVLKSIDTPCSLKQLAKHLSIKSDDDFEALRRRLKAMRRDRQLQENRKGLIFIPEPQPLITGTISAHRDGYGFLIPDEGNDDLFLDRTEMRKVFDGDKVSARVTFTRNDGKLEGEIEEVLERSTQNVVGKLFIEPNKIRVVPENPRINHTIFIDQDFSINAEHEQIVVVEITRQPNIRQAPKGIIKEVLGNALDPGMEIEIALRSFNIPFDWPKDVEAFAKSLPKEPLETDKLNRIDIRELPLVTIDGEDARDFDDAVYCERKKSGGWRLWVAIADVSHYVKVNTAIDKEAFNRSTSVYFPEHVVPMLPEELSNGLCSLKPGVDRLCMVCEMSISENGRLSGYEFYEGVMHSHARLTYTEVGKILQEQDDPESLVRKDRKDLVKHIDELHKLYQALKQQRAQRGAIEFETVETQFIFDENRKIQEIIPRERNDAHKLIEECMLCANVATARFLEKTGLPALFRVHQGPNDKKREALKSYLAELGLFLGGGEDPTPKDYQALFSEIGERSDAHVIQTMMLRSMSQAVYEPENQGHFGLAYPAYAHFTSPIRRYPDLLVHRCIRHIVRSNIENKHVRRCPEQTPLNKGDIYPYDMDQMVFLGEQCSMAERRADDATRDVSNWLKCEYLLEHLGETFTGIIVSTANFGFFVELDGLFAEGMVHVSELGKDFYHYDAGKQRLIGERTRKTFSLGDSVEVTINRIELEQRKVHLGLVSSTKAESNKPAGKPPKKDKKSKDKKSKGNKTKSKTTKKKHAKRLKASGASKKKKSKR